MYNLLPLSLLKTKYEKAILLLISLLISANISAVESVDAVRLLQQATFGPTPADVIKLEQMTEEEWIDEQISAPMTLLRSYHDANYKYPRNNSRRNQDWLKTALHSEDQLRQRMAFALSQIFVVSQEGTNLARYQAGLVNYYDMLITGALGNYRDLMYKVTMHPVMGAYLTYSPNYKADPNGTNEADENYAREILQLMSLGIYLLNDDGSYQLDSNGARIETYTPEQIKGFAKVFTGLCDSRCDPRFADYTVPMVANYNAHDLTEKKLLSTTLAANPVSVEADINAALDDIFAHKNIAPFVSQRLIQMLVTSNPTPAYIARVAAVFNDNGYGVKGDLAAVAKAILLDDEARNGHQGSHARIFGKLREPLLMMTHYFRALDMFDDGAIPVNGLYNLESKLYQAPLSSPSVFNFYHFDYRNPQLLQEAISQGLNEGSLESIDNPQAIDGRTISLESNNYPGYFIQYVNNQVRIDTVEQKEQAAQWKIVKGLAGDNTFSIESVNFPGHFLRHAAGKISLDAKEDSQLYKEDASWHWQEGLAGSKTISLESLNFPNEFIRHSNYLLVRTAIDSELQQNDASFHIKATGINIADLVFPEFELSPEDKMLHRLNFIYGQLIRRGEAFQAYDKLVAMIEAAPTREAGINDVIDHIDLMFTQGDMSAELREQIAYIINMTRMIDTQPNGTLRNVHTDATAMRDIMMLLFTSSDFAIQR